MDAHEHERAMDLIAESAIEGITQPDTDWLQQHLGACSGCAKFADSFGLARQAIRAIPITASDELVAATKARVRIRAMELHERTARAVFLTLSIAVGAFFSTATLYYAWPMVQWIESRFSLPAVIVEPGFIVTWFLPTTLIALLLTAMRSSTQRASSPEVAPEGRH